MACDRCRKVYCGALLRPTGVMSMTRYLLLDIYLLTGGAKGLELHTATAPG